MLFLRKHLRHQSMFLLPNSCRNFVIATDFIFQKRFKSKYFSDSILLKLIILFIKCCCLSEGDFAMTSAVSNLRLWK